MCPVRRLPASLLISALIGLGVVPNARAASAYDPIYRFRTLATRHFIIYFHQGEDRLAARLAAIAEEIWGAIERPLGTSPPALTHVVLVDQSELANGLATPIPYNLIVVTAAWPAGSEFIGKTDDWLRLVFTHEFTHIVHLDRSDGWARVLRSVFGRVPIFFPNLFLPQWHIEGLATYEESAMSGEGRLHAGDFGAIVREAARTRRMEPLDRVNGGLTDWPDGLGAYAYGAGFHEYLAKRFGETSFAALARATAGRVPFTASRVFRQVYGLSLGTLWRDYQTSLIEESSSRVDDAGTRLTHHGFTVSGPRFDRARCERCPDTIVYSVRTPHGFPALYQLSTDQPRPRRLATRYLGSTSGSSKDTIYFDQQELGRNAGLYSDIHALDRTTGTVRQLTFGARLLDPDLSPEGNTLACVQASPGRRDLVLVALGAKVAGAITTLLSEPETQFNAPRWSPDGRTIAVERHVPGHQSAIVLVDVATRTVRTIAAHPQARFVTPTWRPDGRAVIAAADLDEGPFELYEIAVNTATLFDASQPQQAVPRPLTHTAAGATWPDVSPDGKTIVFVGYTTDGFDLFSMPYSASSSETADKAQSAGAEQEAASPAPAIVDDSSVATRSYNPFTTLKPTAWSPIVEGDLDQLRVGFATGGTDVLAYHAYSVSATWLATNRSTLAPSRTEPDWQLTYQYARWRPTWWLSASTQTSFLSGPPDQRGLPTDATLRERQLESGVLFPIRHVRVAQAALFSVVAGVDDFQLSDAFISTRRAAWRAGWALNSARTYGYSISPEEGASIGLTADLARRALGSSANSNTLTVDGRAYISPFAPHHVLAIRLAGAMSTGDPLVRRTFLLGGSQPNLSTLDFGRSAFSLLRGFGADTFAGSHVALLNADYRWPIARPQRGHGTLPFFLHTVHAAVFADVGHAWTQTFDARDLKTSAGGELSFDVVAAYFSRFTTTLGAAWGRDGSHAVPDRGSLYIRIGRAF